MKYKIRFVRHLLLGLYKFRKRRAVSDIKEFTKVYKH